MKKLIPVILCCAMLLACLLYTSQADPIRAEIWPRGTVCRKS